MRLIEPRRHVALSKELGKTFPTLLHLNDQVEASGIKAGIWEDNGYYLIGGSRTDASPEYVTFTMTQEDWNDRQAGKPLKDERVKQALRRTQRLYPALFHI